MVKHRKQRSISPRKISDSHKIDEFMKNSMISPAFQYIEDNYPISHQSHASLASHASQPTQDVSSGDDSFVDSDYDSNDERFNNDEIEPPEESYANATMKKDLRIYKMKDMLRKKRKYMFDKEKEIKEIGRQNSFLETVVNDYENYNNIILDEKRKQKRALKVLSDHIREISKNIKNDEFKLNRVKMDQTELLREIQNIRDEIEHVLRMRGNNDKYVSSDDDDDYHEESDY
jgi:chromosome segregation ATPase